MLRKFVSRPILDWGLASGSRPSPTQSEESVGVPVPVLFRRQTGQLTFFFQISNIISPI